MRHNHKVRQTNEVKILHYKAMKWSGNNARNTVVLLEHKDLLRKRDSPGLILTMRKVGCKPFLIDFAVVVCINSVSAML